MTTDRVRHITGFIGCAVLASFVVGLAHSISSGFAGFWGGLPFWIIVIYVLYLVFYDYYDTCLRQFFKKKEEPAKES